MLNAKEQLIVFFTIGVRLLSYRVAFRATVYHSRATSVKQKRNL